LISRKLQIKIDRRSDDSTRCRFLLESWGLVDSEIDRFGGDRSVSDFRLRTEGEAC
jgi:hypothetical protein